MYQNKFRVAGKVIASKSSDGIVNAFIRTSRKKFKEDDQSFIEVPIRFSGQLASALSNVDLKDKFVDVEARMMNSKVKTSEGDRYLNYLQAEDPLRVSVFSSPDLGGYVNTYSYMGRVAVKKESASGKSTGICVMYELEFSDRPRSATKDELEKYTNGVWVYFGGKYKDSYVDPYINKGDIVMMNGSILSDRAKFTVDGKPVYEISLMGASLQKVTPAAKSSTSQKSSGSGKADSGKAVHIDDDDLPF